MFLVMRLLLLWMNTNLQVVMKLSLMQTDYQAVKARIPNHVKLIAVSKTRSLEEIEALYSLGHRAFGENYPQELKDKQASLPSDIEWHFIGHLQSNKVKYIAPFVHLVHGVDSTKLLNELNKRAISNSRIQDILLQVHIAQEDTKHGFNYDEIIDLFEEHDSGTWTNLRFRGLMGMASNTNATAQVQDEFEGLAAFFGKLGKRHDDAGAFDILSMGMSGDAEIAITAGSTMVRIGTAIFGERQYPTG